MTVLIGDSTQTGTVTALGASATNVNMTTFLAGATGTATTGWLYLPNTTNPGQTVYMVVYGNVALSGSPSSAGLVAQSAAVTSATGWNQFTFSPSVSIVSGNSYGLGIYADQFVDMGLGATSGPGWFIYDTSGTGTWPTAPATFTRAGGSSGNNLSAYLVAAAPAAPVQAMSSVTGASLATRF